MIRQQKTIMEVNVTKPTTKYRLTLPTVGDRGIKARSQWRKWNELNWNPIGQLIPFVSSSHWSAHSLGQLIPIGQLNPLVSSFHFFRFERTFNILQMTVYKRKSKKGQNLAKFGDKSTGQNRPANLQKFTIQTYAKISRKMQFLPKINCKKPYKNLSKKLRCNDDVDLGMN